MARGGDPGVLFLVVMAVLRRHVLGGGLIWSDELAIWLNVALVAVGAPLAATSALSMRLDVIVRLLPERGQAIAAVPAYADIPFLCQGITVRALQVPEDAASRPRNGVGGVTVAVRDLGVSAARYRALLGAAPVATGRVPGLGLSLVQFQIGRQTLSLAEARSGAHNGPADHLLRRGHGAYAFSFNGPPTACWTKTSAMARRCRSCGRLERTPGRLQHNSESPRTVDQEMV